MSARYPGLEIAGTHHGYFKPGREERDVIDAINRSGAEILFVAFGVPLQEIWIERNRHRLKPSVVIGVGGLFDYYSGRIPRAPLALRRTGLEWLWRLAMEPGRLWRRYLLGNAEFLGRVAMLKLFGGVAFVNSPA
jgi:N-acetylglucosaminyldiphosphoundecaprenol N-acetyl-beta-D-mannosaminyltransferase